jgi:hypothetical protein
LGGLVISQRRGKQELDYAVANGTKYEFYYYYLTEMQMGFYQVAVILQ